MQHFAVSVCFLYSNVLLLSYKKNWVIFYTKKYSTSIRYVLYRLLSRKYFYTVLCLSESIKMNGLLGQKCFVRIFIRCNIGYTVSKIAEMKRAIIVK